MKNTKHTPGPWNVRDWPRENYVDGMAYVICDHRNHGLASMCQKGKSPKAKANAKLMATAPELVEVLLLLQEEYRPDAAFDDAYYPYWALFDAVMEKAGIE